MSRKTVEKNKNVKSVCQFSLRVGSVLDSSLAGNGKIPHGKKGGD